MSTSSTKAGVVNERVGHSSMGVCSHGLQHHLFVFAPVSLEVCCEAGLKTVRGCEVKKSFHRPPPPRAQQCPHS